MVVQDWSELRPTIVNLGLGILILRVDIEFGRSGIPSCYSNLSKLSLIDLASKGFEAVD